MEYCIYLSTCIQSNLSLRTPLYYGQFVWSQKCQKSYIPYLYNTYTSVKPTIGSVPLVLKRFDCNWIWQLVLDGVADIDVDYEANDPGLKHPSGVFLSYIIQLSWTKLFFMKYYWKKQSRKIQNGFSQLSYHAPRQPSLYRGVHTAPVKF